MDGKAELHTFAEMLLRLVRDQSIDSCGDALASRRMFGPTGGDLGFGAHDSRARPRREFACALRRRVTVQNLP